MGQLPTERRLMPRIDERPPYLGAIKLEEKIIFLNAENLEILKGYKATVSRKLGLRGYEEIHIVITGISPKFAMALYGSLKAMNPEEIKGV